MIWRNLYRGAFMGAIDLIPGVSSGTIAVVLGIYDHFLEALSGLFSREWRHHLRFLIPLGIGMGSAILAFSRVIQYLIDNHYVPTQFFFLGLIIGVLPMLFRRVDARRNLTAKHIIAMLIAAAFVGSMVFLNPSESGNALTTLTLASGVGLFFAGCIASMAMLLPGVSGAFVLLVIGVYPTAIEALSSFNIPVIMVIGAGVITGIIVSSKGIRHLLVTYPIMMYVIIIGLLLGSIVVVYPGLAGVETLLVSGVTFMLGLGFSAYLGGRRQESPIVPKPATSSGAA